MSAPDPRYLSVVSMPAGPEGAYLARQLIDRVMSSTDDAVALVTDAESARSILRPDEPLEDPRTAVVLLTSGSTGDPKGVCWSRENLLAMSGMWRHRYPDCVDAPRVVALPVTTAGGIGVIVRAVIDGAPLVVVPSIGGAERFDPEVFAEATRSVASDGPIVSLVPTQLALLMRSPLGLEALRSMRRIFLGGAATPSTLLQNARASGLFVVTTYGMTETCGGCVHDGTPLDGVSVAVDDSGRIHLSGPMCAVGYRLRPDETAAAFSPNTFTTGDIGTWDGTHLTVIGRVDDIVQVRGANVAVGAVERTILDSGLVREAVVFAVDDLVDGHRLHAVVVCEDPAAADRAWLDQLRASIRRRLGSAAIPATIRPVAIVPYLPGGKIDRLAVRRMVLREHRADEGT